MEAVKLIIISMAFTVFTLFANSAAFPSEVTWKSMDAGRVQEMMKQGVGLWLIDIRSSNAYEEGHIEGAVNIISSALRYKKMPAGKVLVIVDDSLGQKDALEAADSLLKNGAERVYVLEGGLIAWQSEGLPVAGKSPYRIRGVTSTEFKAALSRQVPLRIFDMRTVAGADKGDLSGSEKISGKNIREKLAALKEKLKADGMSGLQSKLTRGKTIILVFSASENVEALFEKTFAGDKSDIRYLIGGYEALTAQKTKHVAGGCKTCP